MTSTEHPARRRIRIPGMGIAVAIAVMNVATYGFQMVAARRLGPTEYGALAGLMAVLLVLAVVQLGLQATAARRISAEPEHLAQIERGILALTCRAALLVGAVMLLAAPLVSTALRLESVWPAVLLAVAGVPLTIQGGQAGILQGERRWLALAGVYLCVGLPRILFGTLFIWWRPSATAAMAGVAIGLLMPALAGWLALRHPRASTADSAEHHRARPLAREAAHASLALLAFYVLSNIDMVIARNVLDPHQAGLYAGGLIMTKATLFLPQFVVVVAFPAMSTTRRRRRALVLGLLLVACLGGVCSLGAWLLPGVAMLFVGGSAYAEIEAWLGIFALLGTVLAMLQLVVYSVLARQGTRSAYLIWLTAGVLALVGATAGSLSGLLLRVLTVDAVALVVLVSLSLWRMHAEGRAQSPSTSNRG